MTSEASRSGCLVIEASPTDMLVPCRDCGKGTILRIVLAANRGSYALCPGCLKKREPNDP